MSTSLNGKTIAFLVAPEGVEQVELTEPGRPCEQAGGTPELVSTEVGKIQAFNHLTPADTFEADKAADSVTASDYDGAGTARRCRQSRLPAQQRRRRCVHQEFLRRRQAGCGDLPRAVDADRGRRRARPDDHLVAECAPTCSMRAPTGSTRRSSYARAGQTRWCRAASPTTCPPSATHWSAPSPQVSRRQVIGRNPAREC